MKYSPVKADGPEHAARFLKDCKHVCILTGAGLSAASGVPTFRGAGGFWTKKYGDLEKPEQIATMSFFREDPVSCWMWHFDFMKLLDTGIEPNAGH
mmetsp:Transcript_1169/g.799  ORF Transcript_1169/g.799 Transcript_1169/m.799 type:complete len:96 (+) Transcript_1169:297-584(+)